MSRNSSQSASGSGFLRKLTWTILFGLIFGAGLITGQRLLRNGSSPPLVSVEAESEESDESEADGENGPPKSSDQPPDLSFYERLSEGVDSAAEQMEGSASTSGDGARGDGSGEADTAKAATYTLQISAYPERDRARSRLRRFEKMGLDPYLVAAELPDKGTYYRIRIGKFESMEAAKTFKSELERKRGVESAVTPL